ncbi:glycosyl hydrolase [Thermophagus xiamenensis]|uniref:Lysophospholipase L1 n=1 Tax=Thermophagus xiamenensis TaxID=385682 RepID=A0A1I2DWR9_9BACT|nr:glycosyl hydrolase [Thermophagus xiamenensis]SFE85112.1 Lysophospholipase L1 [Thermophagus xiamenensis]
MRHRIFLPGKRKRPYLVIVIVFALMLGIGCSSNIEEGNNIWPEINKEMKPWTRWWWMGSAVDEKELGPLLEEYAAKGFGGVEIAPIYGVKGYEDRYVDFLSARWIELLDYTVSKADSLGMGVDITTGTGWPFGGPHITSDFAARRLYIQKYELTVDSPLLRVKINDPRQRNVGARLIAVTGYDEHGRKRELMPLVNEGGLLNWKPSSGRWTIYAAFDGRTRQRVKRAAPGGEGFTFDHFSEKALYHYLKRFDEAFKDNCPNIRCFFNDSYEVFGASWSQDFLEAFKQRRGYDLSLHLRELYGDGDKDTVARVKSDYRETMSDMLIHNFSTKWTAWAHKYGAHTRNQSHGSPANLLDVYASVDIPEIETFGATHFNIPGFYWDSAHVKRGDHNPLFLKMAASAANLTGKRLVSCETFTWLGEHFRVPLSQCKPEAEQVMLAGVNHIFYHGTAYSPEEAPWPGWLFYASVNFSPSNSFWAHIEGLNQYITRCQSILQSTTSDNDLLVYWPIYDVWHDPEGMEKMMTVHGSKQWLASASIQKLLDKGYTFDFVSDSLLKTLKVRNGVVVPTNGHNQYKAIIIPECERMPEATLKKLIEFSRKGVVVVMQNIPKTVPGLRNWESRQERMKTLLAGFNHRALGEDVAILEDDNSSIYLTPDFEKVLKLNGIEREMVTDLGLKFIRKKSTLGTYYYLVNHTSKDIDETIVLNAPGKYAVIMDPQTGTYGTTTVAHQGRKSMVRFQCKAGEAYFILLTNKTIAHLPKWKYKGVEGEVIEISGPWKLEFIEGGPELPRDRIIDTLQYWTSLDGEWEKYFSGIARYSTIFRVNDLPAESYQLKLQHVGYSSRIVLNGHDLGVLWSEPFIMDVGNYIEEGENTLQIEVANLMSNRIRYMDLNGQEWRKFHEINFVNIGYKPFDASGWEVMPSGLAGPVKLIPIKEVETSPEVIMRKAGSDGLIFNFGTDVPVNKNNIVEVPCSLTYNQYVGYGFDLWTTPKNTMKKSKYDADIKNSGCTSGSSFYFSVKLPEGNYEVTVWLGNPVQESVTTVKAESRRLMVERSEAKTGEVKEHTFIVNVRTPRIEGTDSIIRKKREYEYLNWDEKLTLEFNGDQPSVYGIRIKPASQELTTVFLAGNSTVVDQEYEPYAAWGQMITGFFDTGIVVANYAFSGASLSSFKGLKRMDKIMSLLKPGDYVFIEFGHNDQKQKGEGIGPWQSFSNYLKEFILLTREKGGKPVLVTPMNRRSFDESGKIVHTHGDYPAAMRKVAKEENVPLIDLNVMSKELYEAWGVEESRKAFVQYPANTFRGQNQKLEDNTHFNNYGAYQIALCIVKGIRDLNLDLANHLKPSTPVIDLSNPFPFSGWKLKHSSRSTNQKPDGN